MSRTEIKPRRIERISIKKFRGATTSTDLTLDPTKPIIMIFGENGTGKSTIIDAIDFVCNESHGSLGERSSTNAKKHLPAIGCDASEMVVGIGSGEDTWNAVLGSRKVQVIGPEPRLTAHVLRRSQLLRLIEAPAAERYKEMRKFIDVEGVESCEQSLSAALKSANQRLEIEIRSKQDAEDALRELWHAEGRPGAPAGDAMSWAAERAKANTASLESRRSLVNGLTAALDDFLIERRKVDEARSDLTARNEALSALRCEVESAGSLDAGASMSLITVLEDAQRYLAAPDDKEKCPVCEQAVSADDLRERIAARLSAVTQLRELGNRLRAAETALGNSTAVLASCESSLAKAGRHLRASALAARESDVPTSVVRWEECEPYLAIPPEGVPDDPGKANCLAEVLRPSRETLAEYAEQLSAEINQFNAISQNYRRVLDGDERIRDAETVARNLASALKVVRWQRLSFIQNVLEKVNDNCNEFYSCLHPDEALGDIHLHMDDKQRGSLLQGATFEGEFDVPPQAYYSESHLDTLGFCLFLAVAKHYSKGNAVIALDDIFTSVDSVHLSRIIDLLTKVSSVFDQVIITTHFRQWRDRYRTSQGPGRYAQLIELHKWSLNGGVRTFDTKICIDELAGKLKAEPFDRQGIASQSGVLLEAVLDRLTIILRCHLPRLQNGGYTLGDYFNSLMKLSESLVIRRHDGGGVVQPSEEVFIKPLFDAVNALTFIRNQVGCHFSAVGSDIADADVETFGDSTVKFVSALVCPHCGDMPRQKESNYFKCSCGRIRLAKQ